MVIKKSTKIAAFCAACTLAVIGGGYAVSHVLLNTSITQVEKGISLYLNRVTQAPKEHQFSTFLYEEKPGVFTRNFTLVVVRDNTKFTMPVTLHLGYFKCDFDLALEEAKVNDEYLVEALQLNNLTRLDATGHLSLLGSKLYLQSEADWINSLSQTFGPYRFQAEQANFKETGTATIDMIVDKYENIVTSGIVSNFISDDGVAIRHISFVNEMKGLLHIQDMGKTQIYMEDLWAEPHFSRENHIKVLSFNSMGTKPNQEGDSSLHYEMAVSNYFQAKDIVLKGRIDGVNFLDLEDLRSNVSLMKATSYLLTHNAAFTLDKGSHFTYPGPVKRSEQSSVALENFVFSTEAKVSFINVNNQPTIEGRIHVATDKDVSKVIGGDIADFQDLFVIDDGKSTVEATISYPIFSHHSAKIMVNGEELK